MSNHQPSNIVAIVYDFDGTLSPQPMQEYTVLPAIGVHPEDFWNSVNAETTRTGGEPIITYMRLMYEAVEKAGLKIDRAQLKEMGKNIPYFDGVPDWFDHLNAYIENLGSGQLELRHYIVSSGLREILEGVSIFPSFHNVFASEYYFDAKGQATYPKRVITDTNKTQYLFRINKGIENLSDNINAHMPENDRPIPFSNIIYMGDGLTDVPSMAVTRANGGHAIAVHAKENARQVKVCQNLFRENRCDFYAEADFMQNSVLDKLTKRLLDKLIADFFFQSDVRALRA